jgi:hypothetical protein
MARRMEAQNHMNHYEKKLREAREQFNQEKEVQSILEQEFQVS